MSVSVNRDASFLNASEARAVEAAIRAAVMSILEVFCEVNNKRSHCYKLKLTEAERENTALKIQLQAAEQELQTLRQISYYNQTSSDVTPSHEFISKLPEDPMCFQSPFSLVIKEEPCTENTTCLKSKISHETPECDYPKMDNIQLHQTTSPGAEIKWQIKHVKTLQQQNRSSFNQTREKRIAGDIITGISKNRECVRRYREKIRADPEKYQAWKEKERLRYLLKRKTISDLSESMKNLKRKAWREAKRRNRARKKVQAAATHGIRITDS